MNETVSTDNESGERTQTEGRIRRPARAPERRLSEEVNYFDAPPTFWDEPEEQLNIDIIRRLAGGERFYARSLPNGILDVEVRGETINSFPSAPVRAESDQQISAPDTETVSRNVEPRNFDEDVELIMSQTGTTREVATLARQEYGDDLVSAIMHVTTMPSISQASHGPINRFDYRNFPDARPSSRHRAGSVSRSADPNFDRDVELIMSQTGATRGVATLARQEYGDDLVTAIMELTEL
jgi:NACalpha-BTF3-like transcription factor